MTVRTGPTLRDRIRDAAALVRNNPTELEAISAEDLAAAEAAAREAKRTADARAKVEQNLAARTVALIEDWIALEQSALHDAAQRLAREQLQRQYGLVPLKVAAYNPAPMRLDRPRVELALKNLRDSAPVAYVKGGKSAAEARSEMVRAASDELERPEREARELERSKRAEALGQRERQRAAAIEARKGAALKGKA